MVPRRLTARQVCWPLPSHRRAMQICCAPIISCICAAKFRCRAWSKKPRSWLGGADVRLISLMDHTPGQRQFRDEGKLRDYYRGKGAGMTDVELDTLFDR